jgi:putative ABC transport system permease protein
MIRNFIKTALRSLLKNKGFTFINILGLALGLATCLLIVFYVVDELSYDRYNTKYDRIYRINTDLKYGETVSSFALAAPPVGDALVSNFPEVLKTARLSVAMNIRFKKGNENLMEDKVLYCDKSILEIFTIPMLAGDTHTALNDPTSIVISQSAAKRYFGNTAAVGQTLMMVGDSSVHNVTGVMRDIPSQSHFRADFLIPLAPNTDHSWSHFNTNTYILLKSGADHKKLEAKFDGLMRRNINTADFDYDKFSSKGNYIRMNLTPLTDIHLKSNRQRELAPNGNIEYVYIFSAIALFILLLACINFMNLSTARSANRAREVGVRKVLGSSRKYLIAQFLSESVLVTFTAIVIAALAAWALLPLFNDIAGKQIVIRLQTFVWLLPMLLLITVVVSVLAGSYPAFFLSAFQPIHVLKGKISTGFKGGALRSFLVVTQFAISIFLIIGTLVIYNQLNYIQNKNLGFERDRVIVIKNAQVLHDPKILKNELKQLSGISNATLSSYLPTGTNRWTNSISKEHKGGMFAEYWPVDEDYISTMGMSLVKGRNFSSQLSTDSLGIIINQTAASMLGFANDPINQTIYNGQGEHARKYHVIGVVKDFNFSSLRDNITPLVMVMANDWMASLR